MRKPHGWPCVAALAAVVFSTALHGENAEHGQGDEIEEIVVTGSHLRRAHLVSASPVTEVDAEELLFQGTVRVEDMVRTLPQVFSGQNTSQSNGATGTANLNLRNLGTLRTLVLVNGRRLPIGSPLQGGGADVNQIPSALVESVQVLTGGASAVYGSDAVAGVVDFRMKDDFQGLRIDYQFSQYGHDNDSSRWARVVRDAGYPVAEGSAWDGDTSYLSLVLGGNFDNGRGNVTAYATYRDIEPVWQRDRDYGSCALSDDTTFCYGSSTIPQGRFTDFGLFGADSFDYIVQGDQFVRRQGETFNYGPLNYYQRPDEQYAIGSFAHYELDGGAEVFTELMFMDDRTLSQIAPSGAFFVTNTLGCGNPFLSAQQFEAVCGSFGLTEDDVQTVYIGRRNVEGGNRQQDLRHTTFRGVFGLRGDAWDHWNYHASVQYAEVSMENTYMNDLGTTRIRRALDAVRHPDTGRIACRSAVDGSDPGCVPWNIFETGGVTQDALDYIVLPLFARGTTDQRVAAAHLAGDLGGHGVRLPLAEEGIALAFGVEFRQENLDFNPDENFRAGEGAGQGGATNPVSGGYDVFEVFVEANVPLVEGRPLARELRLDLGLRHSDYDYGIATDTFGARVGWAVNPAVKFRASVQRALRAPNVRELFQPQGFNLFDMSADPCGGPVQNGMTAAGRTFDECARSGVTAAQFGNIAHSPAAQYKFLQGGNPHLEPESADTWSVGAVFSPGAVPGLDITLDYFEVRIEQGVGNLTPEFILNACLDGNLAQCGLVKRGPPGDLWIGSDPGSGHIVALQDNLAIEEVAGVDVIVEYGFEAGGYGSVRVVNILSWIDRWDQRELAGAPTESCGGHWGSVCGFPTPTLRNSLRVVWTTPWDVTATAMWRHLDEVEDRSLAGADLDAVSYIDVAAIWNATGRIEVRGGVNNVFDRAPPIVGQAAGPSIFGNGNTFPGLYDALGRYWFAAVGLSL